MSKSSLLIIIFLYWLQLVLYTLIITLISRLNRFQIDLGIEAGRLRTVVKMAST